VSIAPLRAAFVPQIAAWLSAPALRDSFHPRFPESAEALVSYFQASSRDYFVVFHQDEPAGIVGAEQIDPDASRLEMRKLVGDPQMHGKGIGKRATFLFLYHSFMIRKFEKVYVHSMDTNIRNLNLNSHLGFELEGVFLREIAINNQRRDVVRMALCRQDWVRRFATSQAPGQGTRFQ
jgi:RimJ/RimL family protein N-acetyltransferase